MAGSIIMPKAGMAMEEGVIIQWLKKEGDRIEKGDPVVEVETDKSAMEVEADYGGVLLKILHDEGETVPVTEVIGWIGEAGEELPDAAGRPAAADTAASAADSAPAPSDRAEYAQAGPSPAAAASGEGGRIKATPAARRRAAEEKIDLADVVPTGRSGEIREADIALPAAGSVKASPLAKRIAEREGVSLSGIRGSGPGGKVISRDVRDGTAGPAGMPAEEDRRVPLSRIQQITGKRMLQSHLEIPPVTMNIEADVTRLLEIREELNREKMDSETPLKFTINDFVMKAAAAALQRYPHLNAVFDTDAVIYKGSVNLGMAVATGKGLLVPVVRGAEQLSLSGLSEECRRLTELARESKLSPADLEGGTFTVSNIGKFGITSFTPIINPPEAAILGVCAVSQRLSMEDGEFVTRSRMGLSLTFDHRVVDGAEAAEFFAYLAGLLEKPMLLFV